MTLPMSMALTFVSMLGFWALLRGLGSALAWWAEYLDKREEKALREREDEPYASFAAPLQRRAPKQVVAH